MLFVQPLKQKTTLKQQYITLSFVIVSW